MGYFNWKIGDLLNNPIVKGLGKATETAIKAGIEANAEAKAKEAENKPPPKSTLELNADKGEVIPEKMKKAGQLSYNYGGCIFGKLNGDFFGKSAEKGGHVLVVGGSGSGKSFCFAMPSVLGWSQSVFCIDIKGELYKNTVLFKSKHKVFDPCGITWGNNESKYGYDPFYLLKTARNKTEEARLISSAIIPLPNDIKDPHWIKGARNLLTSAILHYHSLNFSFIDTMKAIAEKSADELVIDIHDNYKDENVKYFIKNFVGMTSKERSGVYSTLHEHIISFATDEDIKSCLNSKNNLLTGR